MMQYGPMASHVWVMSASVDRLQKIQVREPTLDWVPVMRSGSRWYGRGWFGEVGCGLGLCRSWRLSRFVRRRKCT